MKAASVKDGVSEAMWDWLTDRCITTANCIAEGVKQAFGQWLDNNTDAIVEAIADKVAKEKKGE
jgi:hypothetical protein